MLKAYRFSVIMRTLGLITLLILLSLSFTGTQVFAQSGNWILNEMQADPSATQGDANGDGTISTTQDEFVEIYNDTGADTDISGWTLADAVQVRHTFPQGTIVPAGCAVVVFGGGTPTGQFGNAIVQTASTSSLGLNNTNEVVTLNDGSNDLFDVNFAGISTGNDQSVTRDPDVTGGSYVLHSQATGSNGALYSPGTNIDGSNFSGYPCNIPPSVASTSPFDGELGVVTDTNITVNFSEDVSVGQNWASVTCSVSGAISTTTLGEGSSYTLDLSQVLDANDICTVTITASEVTDLAAEPLAMASDYVFAFYVSSSLSCETDLTAIYTIQGSGSSAAVSGTVITTGVVTGDYQDGVAGTDGDLNGFFIQDATGDGNAATSDGIFVYDPQTLLDVTIGQLVLVRGVATEFSGLTQVDTSGQAGYIQDCGNGASITPVTVTLPVASLGDWEAYEGMLTTVQAATGDLTVTDHFNLGRFGTFYLSSGGRLMQFTEVSTPSVAGYNAHLAAVELRTIAVDDGLSIQNPDPLKYPTPEFTASNVLRGGYTTASVTGVLNYAFGEYALQPVLGTYAPVFNAASNPRTEAPQDVGGDVRVASMNVLNFFNGPTFPTARGATSALELERQTAKLVAALAALDADVVGLIEIENTLESPDAVQSLVDALNAVVGAGTYAYIDTGVIGTDEIRQAFIYRPANVTPVGAFAILDSSVDPNYNDSKNRPALAQTFQGPNGGRFTVVVNHFKSKGSDCNDVNDPDAGDGQGNCNGVRTAAAQALAAWLETDPTGSNDPDFLIIGDLNSYAMEDPMAALANAGYTNLVPAFNPNDSYSYLFDGQWGALDHGLANASLLQQVTGAAVWHINADEARILDYNVEFKSANHQTILYSPDAYRSSDHDPLVIGLDLVPNLQFVGPLGTIDEGYGNPNYEWVDIPEATAYNLYVGKAGGGQVLYLQNLEPAAICADTLCSIDPTSQSEAYRLYNGAYVVWVAAQLPDSGTSWYGPFNFTLNATAPNAPELVSADNTNSFSPTLNWALPGAASYATWFEIYVAPSATLGTPEVRRWVRRSQVCVDATCAYEVTLSKNNTEYQLWMRSYGPGGYSTGGVENAPQWAGPLTFTIAVPLPNAPTGITVDPRQGRPQISWDNDPNATRYQLWMGPNPAGNYSAWIEAVDACFEATCTITPAIDWPASGNPYQVWIRAQGPAGNSTGGDLNGWSQGPNLVLPATAPEAPTGLEPTNMDSSNPSFIWNGTLNATWYQFEIKPVNAANGTWTYTKWLLGYTLGSDFEGQDTCGDAVGTCVWTDPALDGVLTANADYQIRVRAYGPGGMGTFTSPVIFTYLGLQD